MSISIKQQNVTIIDFNGKKFISDDIVTVSKKDGSAISGRIIYGCSGIFNKKDPNKTLTIDTSTKFHDSREYINIDDIKDINEYMGEQDEQVK